MGRAVGARHVLMDGQRAAQAIDTTAICLAPLGSIEGGRRRRILVPDAIVEERRRLAEPKRADQRHSRPFHTLGTVAHRTLIGTVAGNEAFRRPAAALADAWVVDTGVALEDARGL